jgi:hypothetical protein
MNEGIHGARLFGTHVGLDIETSHLARNLATEGGSVKFGNESYARLPSQQVGPGCLDRVSHGTDATQTGNDDATTGHSDQQSVLSERNDADPNQETATYFLHIMQ